MFEKIVKANYKPGYEPKNWFELIRDMVYIFDVVPALVLIGMGYLCVKGLAILLGA